MRSDDSDISKYGRLQCDECRRPCSLCVVRMSRMDEICEYFGQ